VAEALQKSLKDRLNYVLNDSLYLIGKLFTEIGLNILFHLQTFEIFIIGSILDPRIKTSFIKAGGLDEKAVLKAVSDVILSRYQITCKFKISNLV
jgi:hypothetical protein